MEDFCFDLDFDDFDLVFGGFSGGGVMGGTRFKNTSTFGGGVDWRQNLSSNSVAWVIHNSSSASSSLRQASLITGLSALTAGGGGKSLPVTPVATVLCGVCDTEFEAEADFFLPLGLGLS